MSRPNPLPKSKLATLRSALSEKPGPVKRWTEEVHILGGQKLVFGLEWIPVLDNFDALLEDRRLSGARSYAATPANDLVGLSSNTYSSNSSSAAIYLAEVVSKGGKELFAMDLDNRRGLDMLCGVIALVDGSPVPGFDRVVPLAKLNEIIEEYRQLQGDQNVRVISNMANLPDADSLRPSLFKERVKEARIRRLPNKKLYRLTGFCAVAAIGLAVFIYVNYEKQKNVVNLQQPQLQLAEPSIDYKRAVATELKKSGRPGNGILRNWEQTVYALPLFINGWRMESFNCSQIECTVKWLREYGSIDDFRGNLPRGARLSPIATLASEQIDNPGWITESLLTTVHALQIDGHIDGLDINDLPHWSQSLEEIANFLQDLSLLTSSTGDKFAAPTLTAPIVVSVPGIEVSAVNEPIVSSGFSFMLHAKHLTLISLPDNVLFRELSLAPRKLTDSNSSTTLTIKGEFYAKGKP